MGRGLVHCSSSGVRIAFVLTVVGITAAATVRDAHAAAEVKSPFPDGKIDLVVKGQGVDALLRRLSRKGLRLSAVDHLADSRMTIAAADYPLRELLEGMERVWSTGRYPARWRRLSSGHYQLWQDPQAKQELERLIRRDRQQIAKDLEALARMGDPPRGVEHSRSAVMRNLTRGPDWRDVNGALVGVLSEMPASARQAVLYGKGAAFTLGSLSPGLQTRLLAGSIGTERQSHKGPDGVPVRETDAQARARFAASRYQLGVSLDRDTGRWQLSLAVEHPKGDGGTEWGKPLGELGELTPEGSSGQKAENPLELSVDPSKWLEVRRNVFRWKEFADFQIAMAHTTGLNVISDYYPGKRPPAGAMIAKASTPAELIKLASQRARYTFVRRQRELRFRSKTWMLDDPDQLPSRLEDQLRQQLSVRGYWTLEDLTPVAALTEGQFANGARIFPTLTPLSGLRPWVLWQELLSDELKSQAATPRGVLLERSDRNALEALLGHPGAPAAGISPRFIASRRVIRILERVEDGTALLAFEIRGADGSGFDLSFKQPIRRVPGPPQPDPD